MKKALCFFIIHIFFYSLDASTAKTIQKISISSDEAEIQQNEDKTTSITYEKNVSIQWKELVLRTEKVILTITNKQNSKITCPNALHVTYKEMTIDAENGICDVAAQTIKLFQNISIKKNKNPEKSYEAISYAHEMLIDLKNKKTKLFGLKNSPLKTIISIEK